MVCFEIRGDTGKRRNTGDPAARSIRLTIHRATGEAERVPVTLRIDTPIEVDYFVHGGILPYVLRQLIAQS